MLCLWNSKSCQLLRDLRRSLLGHLLALLALLLLSINGSGLLLDAVKLLDHESAGNSVQ